jgi:predicted ATP-dependent endonuclease of OLD family
MHIRSAKITNFRLLADVELCLEKRTTVIVGRNNSGKTSLAEVMRRLLSDSKPNFTLEDFSNSSYEGFCSALQAKNDGADEAVIRALIPAIELKLVFKYDLAQSDFGPLASFIIDLDENCSEAIVVIRFELADGGISAFFEGLPVTSMTAESRASFFKTLRERIPLSFRVKLWAVDPIDPTNRKSMQPADLRHLVKTGFINAQRGLDDATARDTDVLARVLEKLFTTASAATADVSDKQIADSLKTAVQGVQETIDTDFAAQLNGLIPTLEAFGYPGLNGPELQTETTLDVGKLLLNFTKVRYAGHEGISLPESYNGLGARNLIFILLQLVGFYKSFRADAPTPGMHLVFIEEPEAHLHPQMQEVFIRQLSKIVDKLVSGQDGTQWPVQFVVSTHSSHVANEAGFESIRYFLPVNNEPGNIRRAKIKDLREGLRSTSADDKKFLHQYLTLTRCDLFFADKAVLVEGLSERLLLPIIIRKLEGAEPALPKLSSQYVTVLEVGGAYAHLFFDLLAFLELPYLVITDLDSVLTPGGTACEVHLGTATSNACIKSWFAPESPLTLTAIMGKQGSDKVKCKARIAYQIPETPGNPCGRTFEDAFILANSALFGLPNSSPQQLETEAQAIASKVKKSDFALKYALTDTSWTSPTYILDGIRWLASADIQLPAPLSIAAPAMASGSD